MVIKKVKGRIIRLPRCRVKTAKNTVLGLDCSSATIGWGLIALNEKPTLVAYGHIKPLPSKGHSLLERLNDTYEKISELCDELEPTYVSVEDIVMFMKGKSQARTITILTAFNRVAALAAYRKVGKVFYYSVHEIRKFIKVGTPGIVDKITKTDLPEIIKTKLEPDFNIMVKEKGKYKGGPRDETLDEADGIAAAWAAVLDIKE